MGNYTVRAACFCGALLAFVVIVLIFDTIAIYALCKLSFEMVRFYVIRPGDALGNATASVAAWHLLMIFTGNVIIIICLLALIVFSGLGKAGRKTKIPPPNQPPGKD
jgi:hypothetical protein